MQFGIKIGNYNFNGPFSKTGPIKNSSGVYVILDCHNTTNYVVDVGESGSLQSRLDNHDRKNCWEKHCTGQIKAAVLYVNEYNRMRIEKELRASYRPTCGQR